jgi:hypothetical protein
MNEEVKACGLLGSLRTFVAEHARGVLFSNDRQGTATILINEAADALESMMREKDAMEQRVADAYKRGWQEGCRTVRAALDMTLDKGR